MSVKFQLNLYMLTALGTKYLCGSIPREEEGYSYVGGTIFYIDDTSQEEVEFFDQHGEIMEDVGVGSRPFAYQVITPDPNGKKKYYVFYPQLWGSKRWTWYDTESDPENPSYVYESLGTTNAIGSGKANTDLVMAADSGKYVTDNSNGVATIWYIIKQMRDGLYGGCDDWFVGSRAELDELRKFMAANPTVLAELGITNWFSSSYIWSSAENSAQTAWAWDYNYQYWNDNYKSYSYFSVCGVRAF